MTVERISEEVLVEAEHDIATGWAVGVEQGDRLIPALRAAYAELDQLTRQLEFWKGVAGKAVARAALLAGGGSADLDPVAIHLSLVPQLDPDVEPVRERPTEPHEHQPTEEADDVCRYCGAYRDDLHVHPEVISEEDLDREAEELLHAISNPDLARRAMLDPEYAQHLATLITRQETGPSE